MTLIPPIAFSVIADPASRSLTFARSASRKELKAILGAATSAAIFTTIKIASDRRVSALAHHRTC